MFNKILTNTFIELRQ